MRKADETLRPTSPRPLPVLDAGRREEPTIDLDVDDLMDESELIEVGDRTIEPSLVIPHMPPANDSARLFFDWPPESLISIGERLLADQGRAERSSVERPSPERQKTARSRKPPVRRRSRRAELPVVD